MLDDWFEQFGHTVILGPTNSGKTTFAKFLLNKFRWRYFVVCSPHREHKYFQSRRGCRRQMSAQSKEGFKKISDQLLDPESQKYEKQHKSIIWFDDFNQISDMSRDTAATQLYNRGRHLGFRILHVVHNMTAIGPSLRANVRYLVFSDKISGCELKSLISQYDLQDPDGMAQFMRDKKIYPRFMLIDRETGSSQVFENEDFLDMEDNESDEDEPTPQKRVYDKTVEITPPPQSTLGQGEVPILQSPQPVMNALARQAGRDFYDQSHNVVNINQQINSSQRVVEQKITHQIQINEQHHQVALMHHVSRTQLKQLVAKPYRTREDEYRIVECLRSLDIKWKIPPSIYNYELALKQVWGRLYEGSEYVPSHEKKNTLKDAAHLVQTLSNMNIDNLSSSLVQAVPLIKNFLPIQF